MRLSITLTLVKYHRDPIFRCFEWDLYSRPDIRGDVMMRRFMVIDRVANYATTSSLRLTSRYIALFSLFFFGKIALHGTPGRFTTLFNKKFDEKVMAMLIISVSLIKGTYLILLNLAERYRGKADKMEHTGKVEHLN